MVKTYVNGETFLYLGEPYKLSIDNYKEVAVVGDSLQFPHFLQFRLKKELESWYWKRAEEHITKRVEWFAKRMNVEYKNVTIADTKSRWGACTHDNRLQFNWRLIMTPHAVLDSVVVHELAHTIEKNHSKDFWRHVLRILPGYKAHRAWINYHQENLVV